MESPKAAGRLALAALRPREQSSDSSQDTAAPHPFGVLEQSVPRPARSARLPRDLQAPQAPRFRTTYNLIVPSLCGQDPGAKVTAALSCATYLPGPLKITFTRLGSEVSLGPAAGQMALFSRTDPFCWGP